MSIHRNSDAASVFSFFQEIEKIPRGSGNEKAISDYIVAFAKEKGFWYQQDAFHNVIVKKPASAGYEDAPTVMLQGHMDMVCEKEWDISHDFLQDPIELETENDWLHAKGTTLGADDGIAVAMMLAVLAEDDLPHPAIEAVFTVDEEVGMTGAQNLDTSCLTAKYLINMDTEEEGVLLAGCCGGRRVHISLPIEQEAIPSHAVAKQLRIFGLFGGHSGSEIHLQRANADILMGRVCSNLCKEISSFKLSAIGGGQMDNAICRDATAILVVDASDTIQAKTLVAALEATLQQEYANCDTNLRITLEDCPLPAQTYSRITTQRIADILLLMPYGVQSMCLDLPGLVESSTNLGVVKEDHGTIIFESAVRSSVFSRKILIQEKMETIARLCGATLSFGGEYPGWNYNPSSKLLHLAEETFQSMFGKKPIVQAIHAGLECGLFAEKMPGLDIIAFGPDMRDVHTPKERLSISSTIRSYQFLCAMLAAIHE